MQRDAKTENQRARAEPNRKQKYCRAYICRSLQRGLRRRPFRRAPPAVTGFDLQLYEKK